MKDNARVFFTLMTVCCVCAGDVRGALGQDDKQADQEKEACIGNLKQIYEAIQKYRRDHKALPDWLSDLAPSYLPDKSVLVCPVTKRTGKISNFGIVDPHLSNAYLFEFANTDMGAIYNGGKIKMLEWKQKQMGVVGSVVPMVRCHLHNQTLNLSFDGEIYESGSSWEDLFSVVDKADLSPEKLFGKDFARLAGGGGGGGGGGASAYSYPPRSAEAKTNQVDLSQFYNASLAKAWHPAAAGTQGYDLAPLPQGLQTFADVSFDVRGVVQIAGRKLEEAGGKFPSEVKGIPFGARCKRLHFLHSTGWSVPEGTKIGSYRLNYSNGETRELPIIYGQQVRDWFGNSSSQPLDKNSVIAWSIKPPRDADNKTLFKTSWENPLPDGEIKSIDYISAGSDAAPFLIAITAE